MELGFSTGACWFMNIDDVLPIIKKAGFNNVEILGNTPHISYNKQKLKKTNSILKDLELNPLTFHTPFINGIDCAESLTKNKEYIDKSFNLCEIMNIRTMVIHPSEKENNIKDREERIKYIYANFEYIIKKAEETKITVAVETILPHLLLGNILEIYSLYMNFSHRFFKICFDTSHANLTKNLNSYFSLLNKDIESIHLSDNKGIYDDHLIPGEGIINWKKFFNNLYKFKYNKYIIIEINLYNEKDPDKLFERIKFAKKQCKQYIK